MLGRGEEKKKKKRALTGNRTRASRVAGENSTTEPSVLHVKVGANIIVFISLCVTPAGRPLGQEF